MFTGLIEEVGKILSIERSERSLRLIVLAERVLQETAVGDSIAVNGACLTVTHLGKGQMTVDVVPETVERTTLRKATIGMRVNLERAMLAGGRFGGHLVNGHVDGIGQIVRVDTVDIARVLTVLGPPEVLRYVVEKGSITIDGVSLTVMDVQDSAFRVSLIPHTNAMTTLQSIKAGDSVNLEADVVGKYVEKLLGLSDSRQKHPPQGLTVERLRELGY